MTRVLAFAVLMLCFGGEAASKQPLTRVTILVDAFGQKSELRKDWGFAALIEHDGLRILFDTGNNADWLRHNAEALKVDLTRLDFVVISHRHGDHTDGLHHLRRVNPKVRIYAPNDEYFGGPTPPAFFSRGVDALPAYMRYFDGKVPASIPHGSPWKDADVHRVEGPTRIGPGINLIRNVSSGPSFTETPEVSLVLDTPTGRVLIVGCSHPGIERILESADAKGHPVRTLIGGLHWVTSTESEIARLASALRDQWRVGSVAPGHCTGEVGFAVLQRAFGERFVYAGLGTTIDLTSPSAIAR